MPGQDARSRRIDLNCRTCLVAAALRGTADKIDITAKRDTAKAMAGLWEFPGGKLEPGELPETALVRELNEELGIDLTESCLAPLTFASHLYEDFHLLMPVYVARQWKGEPQGLDGQALKWVQPTRLRDLDMPPADEPLIALLCDLL